MLNRIGRFIKKVRSRKGYTLVEAATVVAITGAMAIVSVPIASDKIEDSKIATAGGTTQAIATAMVKFFGDTSNFPVATTVAAGVITAKIKVLRSGLGANASLETTNNLDPDLENGSTATPALKLWKPTSGTKADAANADANLNNHLVTDAVGYTTGGLNWLGPYIPSVDQDPWGRNYLAYMEAIDFGSFNTVTATSTDGTTFTTITENTNVKVPVHAFSGVSGGRVRIYGWILSGGPDEKLQTSPVDSILKGDDIGTILALPAQVKGTNDKGQDSR